MCDFRGKTALVTGASRGIGREITKRLVECGAKVFALGKTQSNLNNLQQDIPSVIPVCVDISDWNKTKTAVENIGVIDLLVNNAGIYEEILFGEITEEIFDRIFSVNVKPVINVSQIVVKNLKEQNKSGAIVNISSILSIKTELNTMIHSASKAAVDKFTKVMAVEFGPYKIRCNSVNPTVVETEQAKSILDDVTTSTKLKSKIPLGEFCSVKDVAETVLFLLSDHARMINGVNFPVDGGYAAV
ncbi:L-xylulose reductase-like [Centruroides vittatus]|uniref:L-xylulose reductase-like n=1 Tax=Centruroides vittatus TaxID=120091 RepID=UPI003510C880